MKNLIKHQTNKILFFLLILFQIFPVTKAQIYKVDYKTLPSKLLTGDEPIIISILEDVESAKKLYEDIIEDPSITDKFIIYSTDVLNENKSILGISEFKPEEKKFLSALNKTLGIMYVLEWKFFPDDSSFQLNIFSTKKYNKLYSNTFYNSINSNPVLDVKNLLVENLEPVYTFAFGELEVGSVLEETKFKLYKDINLFKEWSGKQKHKIETGKYKLISEAEAYIKDEREIDILGGQLTVIEISLEPDMAFLPNVYSDDSRIVNVKPNYDRGQLKIFFDLEAEKEEEHNIELSIMDKLTKQIIGAKQISGDIKEIKPGKNKVITWQYKKDLDKNTQLKNYEIKISVEETGGIAWYIYAGGSAALVGGVIAILAGSKGEEGGIVERQKIGTPPVRPEGN